MVLGKAGDVLLSANKRGGGVSVSGEEGHVTLSTNGDSGVVSVWGEDKRGRSAIIKVGEYGGRFLVYGKGSDELRAAMAVNEYGNGAVSAWDKNGYRIASLK